MNLIFSFGLALLITAAIMPLCLRFASTLGLMDAPEPERKVHSAVIPRSGGIGIVAGALIAGALWMPIDGAMPLFVAIAIVVMFGYLDDRFDLTPSWKLVAQILAALVLVAGYGGFTFLPFMGIDPAPVWLALPATVLFVIAITNAVNLSDGMDGLAAGNSLLSLGLLAVLAFEVGETGYVVLTLAIAGGLIGFLRFNTYPARLFMGDTGSQFLGFCAAAVTVLIMQNEPLVISPVLPLLIFGLPIVDTAMVMSIRLVRGVPVFNADRSHLHHQLMEMGFRHYEVVIILYGLQAVAVALAWMLRHAVDLAVAGAFAAYATSVLGLLYAARISGWRARRTGAASVERRNLWLRKLKWCHRNAGEVVAGAVAAFFLGFAVLVEPPTAQTTATSLLAAGVLAAVLVWTRNGSDLVTRLICASVAVFMASVSLIGPAAQPVVQAGADLYLLGLAFVLLVGMRLTRKRLFRLDSQDYLVLLICAVVPFIEVEQLDGMQLTGVVLRLAVLLYACEFVLARAGRGRSVLNAAGLTTLCIVAI